MLIFCYAYFAKTEGCINLISHPEPTEINGNLDANFYIVL